jgi:hypothetical protein
MRSARVQRSVSRICALALAFVLLCAQMPAVALSLPELAALEPMTFSARTPGAGATVGMSDPDVSVKALDTGGNDIEEATATIDGASVPVVLSGAGTPDVTASFSTFDLTQGEHTVSMTLTSLTGGVATDTWTFTVAPQVNHTLTYTATPGGSIVGSSTQTVRYGTSSTQLEGFENVGEWTVTTGGSASQSVDTTNVLHGPTSLKLTSSPSTPDSMTISY